MDTVKILLDTDIGSDIDDALCLAYLLAQPRCEILGITTCSSEPEKRAEIVDSMCRYMGKEIPIFPGVTAEKAPGNNRYILRCAVPAECSYQEARKAAFGVMQNFAEDQKLILSADVFDYKIKEGYPKNEAGILYLPSKAFDNPVLAFQAGLEVAV